MKKETLPLLDGLIDPETNRPRSRHFWLVLGGVIFAQLAGLWMLCSQQVSQAEVRHAQVQMEKVALADCLQHTPPASLAVCTGRMPQDDRVPVRIEQVTMASARAGTVPVVYTR